MAKVGAQRAAELTGKSKSTVQRAMNSGKLSYELDANNRRIIDVSELERVFGLSGNGGNDNDDSVEAELKKATDMIEMERMKMQIKALETQLDTATTQIDDLKEQRDQWQKQAQQVLLTSQYSQKQAEELKAEIKERDERAKAQRQKIMDERMKNMKGQNQNQNRPADQKPAEQKAPRVMGSNPQQDAEASAPFDFQTLWQKIKGRASA